MRIKFEIVFVVACIYIYIMLLMVVSAGAETLPCKIVISGQVATELSLFESFEVPVNIAVPVEKQDINKLEVNNITEKSM